MKKKFETLNGYLAADVMTAVTVVLLVCFLQNKNSKGWFSISGAMTFGLLFYAMFVSKTVVKNKSKQSIFTKNEDNDTVSECKSGEKATNIDGVKTNGVVYKIPDGVHAVVTKENKVKVNSLWGGFIYKVRGGELTAPPDEKWNKLFEK
jgi:hypothetical protein